MSGAPAGGGPGTPDDAPRAKDAVRIRGRSTVAFLSEPPLPPLLPRSSNEVASAEPPSPLLRTPLRNRPRSVHGSVATTVPDTPTRERSRRCTAFGGSVAPSSGSIAPSAAAAAPVAQAKTQKERMLMAAAQAAQAKHEQKQRTEEFSDANNRFAPAHDALPPWRLFIRQRIIENQLLDRVVMTVIIANSVILAIEDPSPGAKNPSSFHVLEIIFFTCYCFECFLRVSGMRLYGAPGAFFGYRKNIYSKHGKVVATKLTLNWWGILDFLVVLSGFFSLVLPKAVYENGGPMQALKGFRLVRPLKAVSAFTQMRVLMKSILQSLPKLFDIAILFVFFLAGFALIGVQLFTGVLRNRCYRSIDLFAYDYPAAHEGPLALGPASKQFKKLSGVADPGGTESGRFCSNQTGVMQGYHCSWGWLCVADSGSIFANSFDSFPDAFLTLGVSVTREGWAAVMYSMIDSTNKFSAVYFIFVTFVGSYCIINLTVVIVNNIFDYNVAYEQAKKDLALYRTENPQKAEELDTRHATEEYAEYLHNRNLANHHSRDPPDRGFPVALRAAESQRHAAAAAAQKSPRGGGGGAHGQRHGDDEDSLLGLTATAFGTTASANDSNASFPVPKRPAQRTRNDSYHSDFLAPRDKKDSHDDLLDELLLSTSQPTEVQQFPEAKLLTNLNGCQRALVGVVNARSYEYFLFTTIMGNILTLSCWHFGISSDAVIVLLWFNLVFSAVFVTDSIMKMIVFTPAIYFKKGWNIFDFCIAVISLIHVVFENPFRHTDITPGDTSATTFSVQLLQVLRSCQVVRVLKVIVQFKRLERWARVFATSITSVATLTALLALLIFIYALLGMQLFAGRFCVADLKRNGVSTIPDWSFFNQRHTYLSRLDADTKGNGTTAFPGASLRAELGEQSSRLREEEKHIQGCTLPRANFEDVFLASLSLFQILSGEDWQYIMYNGMSSRGSVSSIFFLSWYFIGNCLLLNLFVSILISRVNSIKEMDAAIQAISQEWRVERKELMVAGSRDAHKLDQLAQQRKKAAQRRLRARRRQGRRDGEDGSGSSHGDDRSGSDSTAPSSSSQGSESVTASNSDATDPVGRARDSASDFVDSSDEDRVTPDTARLGAPDADGADAVAGNPLKSAMKGKKVVVQPFSWVPATQKELSPEEVAEARERRRLKRRRRQLKDGGSQLVLRQAAGQHSSDEEPEAIQRWKERRARKIQVRKQQHEDAQQQWHQEVERRMSIGLPPPAIPPALRRDTLLALDTDSDDESDLSVCTDDSSLSDAEKDRRRTERKRRRRQKPYLKQIKKKVSDWYDAATVFTDVQLNRLNSLFCEYRTGFVKVSESRVTEVIVMTAIFCSCATLAMYNPIRAPDTWMAKTLATVDLILGGIFCLEAFVKTVAYGFIFGEDTYLRRDSPWNKLDFFIVVMSLVSILAPEGSPLTDLRMLKAVRALRPLRFINKFSGLKLVIGSLWSALPSLGMVMVLGFLGWLVFAILGVQLFSGSFYACTRQEWGDMTAQYPNKTACLAATEPGLQWISSDSNFDDIFHAFLTLFEIGTLEGWVDIMYLGMDSVSHETAPIKDNRPLVAIYFVLFVFLGAYFVVNLFVSALVDAFQDQRGDRGLLTDDQRVWIAFQKTLLKHVKQPIKLDESSSGFRYQCTRVVVNPRFEWFINICIVLNVLVIASEHYGEPGWWLTTHEVLNYLFIAVFLGEAVAKIVAYRRRVYFSSWANRFDFFIVCTSCVGIVLTMFQYSFGGISSIFRAFRLLRLVRLINSATGVNNLIQTLFLTLPTMANVSGMMLLMFFCYAVLGVFLFGRVQEGQRELNHRATFHDFYSAILLLLRIATGEAWPILMHEAAVRPPFCADRIDACGDPTLAYLYFVTFVVLETYIILNVFIAVLLDSFNDVVTNNCMDEGISEKELDRFFYVWRRFDPLQTCEMELELCTKFLRELGEPLGPEKSLATDKYIFRRYLCTMRKEDFSEDRQHVTQVNMLMHLYLISYEMSTGLSVPKNVRKEFRRKTKQMYSKMVDERMRETKKRQSIAAAAAAAGGGGGGGGANAPTPPGQSPLALTLQIVSSSSFLGGSASQPGSPAAAAAAAAASGSPGAQRGLGGSFAASLGGSFGRQGAPADDDESSDEGGPPVDPASSPVVLAEDVRRGNPFLLYYTVVNLQAVWRGKLLRIRQKLQAEGGRRRPSKQSTSELALKQRASYEGNRALASRMGMNIDDLDLTEVRALEAEAQKNDLEDELLGLSTSDAKAPPPPPASSRTTTVLPHTRHHYRRNTRPASYTKSHTKTPASPAPASLGGYSKPAAPPSAKPRWQAHSRAADAEAPVSRAAAQPPPGLRPPSPLSQLSRIFSLDDQRVAQERRGGGGGVGSGHPAGGPLLPVARYTLTPTKLSSQSLRSSFGSPAPRRRVYSARKSPGSTPLAPLEALGGLPAPEAPLSPIASEISYGASSLQNASSNGLHALVGRQHSMENSGWTAVDAEVESNAQTRGLYVASEGHDSLDSTTPCPPPAMLTVDELL